MSVYALREANAIRTSATICGTRYIETPGQETQKGIRKWKDASRAIGTAETIVIVSDIIEDDEKWIAQRAHHTMTGNKPKRGR